MNMIEKVARAINPDDFSIECSVGPDCSACKAIKNVAMENAKAAILAMREPSEGMIEAGSAHMLDDGDKVSLDIWHIMIDAALKEE